MAKKRSSATQGDHAVSFKNEVILWGVFALSIILFISNFGFAGKAGNFISSIFFGLFGLTAYIFPILLFAGTAFIISNKDNMTAVIKAAASGVFVIFICMFLELTAGSRQAGTPLDSYLWAAEYKFGGGFVGGLLTWLIRPNLGTVSAYVIDIIMLIICLILITQRSFWKQIKSGSRRVYDSAKNETIRQHQQYEQRRQRRMDNKVTGVSTDTSIKDAVKSKLSDNINEIHPDMIQAQDFPIHMMGQPDPVQDTEPEMRMEQMSGMERAAAGMGTASGVEYQPEILPFVSGVFPADGNMPDGNIFNRNMLDGNIFNGNMPDGNMPDGNISNGNMLDENISNGNMPDRNMHAASAQDGAAGYASLRQDGAAGYASLRQDGTAGYAALQQDGAAEYLDNIIPITSQKVTLRPNQAQEEEAEILAARRKSPQQKVSAVEQAEDILSKTSDLFSELLPDIGTAPAPQQDAAGGQAGDGDVSPGMNAEMADIRESGWDIPSGINGEAASAGDWDADSSLGMSRETAGIRGSGLETSPGMNGEAVSAGAWNADTSPGMSRETAGIRGSGLETSPEMNGEAVSAGVWDADTSAGMQGQPAGIRGNGWEALPGMNGEAASARVWDADTSTGMQGDTAGIKGSGLEISPGMNGKAAPAGALEASPGMYRETSDTERGAVPEMETPASAAQDIQQIDPESLFLEEMELLAPAAPAASADNHLPAQPPQPAKPAPAGTAPRTPAVHNNPKQSQAEIASGVTDIGVQLQQAQPVMKREYILPPASLLKHGDPNQTGDSRQHLQETALKLQQTLKNFGVNVTILNVSCGPSVTRYEIQPEMGVKVSKIVNLSDDIKLNLAAADIRIEAPIPGKAAIGIEVPNKENVPVMFRDLVESEEFRKQQSPCTFAAGKDIAGQTVVTDICKMPHLLIAGATGSGKSVCINTIIMSIIYKADPEDVKMIMIDPKVVELSVYNGIPHLLLPVVTDPKKAAGALHWAVSEMMERYQKFADCGVRDMKGYNAKIKKLESIADDTKPQKMPYIVIIVDELADLMMAAPGDVEDAICRLAQLARAAGIHLIIATQRPSVNVITGLIKANMPSRIAFSVTSGIDSRTILDMNGAEKLLGKGDMLFYPQGYQKPVRVQGAFVSDSEVSEVVEFLTQQNGTSQYSSAIEQKVADAASGAGGASADASPKDERDAYFADAARLLIEKDKASVSMLQRYFKIGFNRAARIMDQLEEAGVVGEEEGTKPRKILMGPEEFAQYEEEVL